MCQVLAFRSIKIKRLAMAAMCCANILVMMYVYAFLTFRQFPSQFEQPRTLNVSQNKPSSSLVKLVMLKLPEWIHQRVTSLTIPNSKASAGLNSSSLKYLGNKHGNRLKYMAKQFWPRFQEKDITLIRKTLKIFDQVLTRIGIDYFMYGGTLIGSYRHHGPVPWDDDVDVMVSLTASKFLYGVLRKLRPKYIINTDQKVFWKFFSALANPIKHYKWKWPFMDVFFYAENETHIWNIMPKYKTRFVFQKKFVFPMRRRPFMDLLLPAPHNPIAILAKTYDIGICKSGSWNHIIEDTSSEITLPCSALYSRCPFVWRKFMNGGCNESLIQNGSVISYFFDKDVVC